MRPIRRVEYTVEDEATVLVAASGTVEYRWAAGETDMAGDYFALWTVLWNDGTPETFPTIDYDIVHIDADLGIG